MLALLLALASTADATPHDPNDYAALDTQLQPLGDITIDTDALTITGAASYTGVVGPEGAAVFTFGSIGLPAPHTVTVTGTRPLVLLSQSDFVISGSIDASASGVAAGAGGYDGGVLGGTGLGPGGGPAGIGIGSGGGFGSAGDPGDQAGGAANGDLRALLEGGSGGGGVLIVNPSGSGGGGGGAVELGAVGTFDLTSGASILVNGSVADDTGGGGAGGGILLHGAGGPLEGTLQAVGGTPMAGAAGGGGRIVTSDRLTLVGTVDVGGGVFLQTDDLDGDGTADGADCDPYDPVNGDADGDGVCDVEDLCPDGDDQVDSDFDGVPDDCEASVFLHWSFDGTPGTVTGTGYVFTDDSGNGNDGTVYDDPATPDDCSIQSSPANFGEGWRHQTQTDENRIDLTTPFTPTGAWSIAFWHDMFGGVTAPLFDHTSTDHVFRLTATVNNTATLSIAGQPSIQWDVSGYISQATFAHIALVADPDGIDGVDVDGDGNEDAIALYVDGDLMTSTAAVDLHLYDVGISMPSFGDGSDTDSQQQNGHGDTDELWIFDGTALTPHAIEALFTSNALCADVDVDGDGLAGVCDACPLDDASACDLDGDGCTDDTDLDGLNDCVDACPLEDASACDLDGDGCFDDADGDGFDDCTDACPTEDASACDADLDGCLDDGDNDGVGDCLDGCPAENASACDLDADGCIDNSDGDLLDDCADACPTEDGTPCDFDADGCLDDVDNDGLDDCFDLCPGEDASACDADLDGCLDDTDLDLVNDCADACPTEDASVCDNDGDGCLDDADGDGLDDCTDACPAENGTACDLDGDGCLDDADGDGADDCTDPCPDDPADDSDGDGSCDGVDLCFGDDATGDTDGDTVCDDNDTVDPWTSVVLGSGASRYGIELSDPDGDGDLDILAPDSFGDIRWVENTGSGTFAPEVVLASATNSVRHAHFGDIDGDTIPDLLASEYFNGRLLMFPGLGDMTFGPEVVLDTTTNGRDFTITDFFDDGFPEVAWSSFSGFVGWYDNPDGTLAARVDVNTRNSFIAAAADIDEDGLLDLVGVSNSGVHSYPNTGSGFGPEVQLSPHNSRGFLFADFDGDTDRDLLLASDDELFYQRNLTGLPGTNVLYADHSATNDARFGDVLDVDDDGDLDAVYLRANNEILVLINDGTDLTPTQVQISPVGNHDAQAADLDGDGDDDVIASDGGDLVWLINPTYDLCTGDVTTGDSDGDEVCNDLDVCTGDDASGDPDGDGVCSDLDPCPSDAADDSDGDGSCDSVDLCTGDDTAGDADGDGVCSDLDPCPDDADDDLDGDGVCGDLDPCPVAYFDDRDGDGLCDDADPCYGTGVDTDGDGACDDQEDGWDWPATFVSDQFLYKDIELVDLDQDGDLDAAVGSDTTLRVLLNDGTGTFTYDAGYGPSAHLLRLAQGEIDGDGLPDFASADNSASRRTAYQLGDGAGGVGPYTDLDPAGFANNTAQSPRIFDLFDDGFGEVLYSRNGELVWWGNAAGVPDTRVALTADWANHLVAFDLDGDGLLEVGGTNGNRWGYYANTGTDLAPGVLVDVLAASSMATGDGDLDGDTDVFVAGAEGLVLFTVGGGALTPRPLNTGTDADGQAHWLDLDGDGFEDLLVAGTDDVVRVWWGDATGITPAHTAIHTALTGIQDLEAGDLNGDGDADLIYRDDANDLHVVFSRFCTGDFAAGDTDDDGICDDLDLCFGDQLTGDTDGDGVCDDADPCPTDDPDDSDSDGVCDSDDACDGDDGSGDTDGDGVCDDTDPCPLDANDDSDGDGSCDSDDLCTGIDLAGDPDGDGVCSDVDPCPVDPADDSDGDGSCDSADLCIGNDGSGDPDGDGVCDDLDPCPLDVADDSDGDGVCDTDDLCAGFDDGVDGDGDGTPDGCDPCPTDAADDSDGDGSCDSADLCQGDDTSGDADGDGFCATDTDGQVVDCDDATADTAPGATELCDGLDNDCDGTVPNDETDPDGDTFLACADDCDDLDEAAYPGAPEICDDGIDQDCDGVDEPCPDPLGDSGTVDTGLGGEEKGCSCSTGPTPVSGLWLLGLLALAARRR